MTNQANKRSKFCGYSFPARPTRREKASTNFIVCSLFTIFIVAGIANFTAVALFKENFSSFSPLPPKKEIVEIKKELTECSKITRHKEI